MMYKTTYSQGSKLTRENRLVECVIEIHNSSKQLITNLSVRWLWLRLLWHNRCFNNTNMLVQQWLHQRLSLAVVRGNPASILACVQVWSDFSHPRCINRCRCLPLSFLSVNSVCLLTAFSVSFIVFRMFCLSFLQIPLCSIVSLPFLTIPITARPMMKTPRCDMSHLENPIRPSIDMSAVASMLVFRLPFDFCFYIGLGSW